MEERARSCLLRSKATLEQDIKASYLMDHMISDGVLTNDDEEKVLSKASRKDQAAALVELILVKDNRAYISFYNALIRESYGDLASLLHSDLPLLTPEGEKSFTNGVSPSVQAILSVGGVPQRPVVFVNRPDLLAVIREKLFRLQEVPGWVTVFGMAGSGKSVIAAEVVRDHMLIKTCFPDGVHWLSVGQCERADLLVRMQSLCFRLEQCQSFDASQRPPGSLEEAKERLRFLFLRRFPRFFDIQARVLVTTRNRVLTDSVSGTKFEVAVENGLDEEKAMEILALYVNGKAQKLPEQARSIVSECKGSPLVVSLIGALLREFPDRWCYYLRQLRLKQFKRIRKSSSYDYDALDQAMDSSLQVLEPEHQELYRDLSVMQKDIKVPAKVLSVLWGLELEEVEDVLQEFELHKKMVRQYQKFFKKRPLSSRDKEALYWYQFLPYHMAKAGLAKELCTLMFSLDWVKEKAQIMGSAHLINDYVEYRDILDKENSDVRVQFQEFLSLNGHQLEQRPFPDVLQLALSQPTNSEVYRQAWMQVQNGASRGQLYIDWVNKNSESSLSRLVMQPHQGPVYYACFSKDGSKIASCGGNKALRVFKATTGEKLQEIRAHDEDIMCCAFSPDDRQIATCGSDRKVKLWSVERGDLIREFEAEHKEQINHCMFTNTGRRVLLATCSDDEYTNAKLWNPNKKISQNTLFGHNEPVNHCCFSPNDAYLATSSSDGTLKLFEVSSTNIWKSINVDDFFPESDGEIKALVKCSTWSADGSRIICAARNTVFVFDVETLDMLLEMKTSRLSTVQYCHACPNSSLLAVALSHYTVELWNFENSKKQAECNGHLSWVHCVQFSPDGSLLLSSSDDQTIRLWETNRVHTSSAVALKRDTDVLFSGSDLTIVVPDCSNRVQVRTGSTGAVLFESEELQSRIRSTCISRNAAIVAVGCENGTVQVQYLLCSASGCIVFSAGHRWHEQSSAGMRFREVFFCAQAGVLKVTQLPLSAGWRALELLNLHRDLVLALGIEAGREGDCIYAELKRWSFKISIAYSHVFEFPRGKEWVELTGHTKTVHHCLFTEDKETLVTSSEDSTIRVWKWRTGECLLLEGHREAVRKFQLLNSCSSSHLLSWSFDGTVKMWDLNRGQMLQDLACHESAVLSCDSSCDGLLLATTSADRTAKVWNSSSWKMIFLLKGHKDCVRSCRFSWDNKRLATGDDNGEIRLWSMLDGALLKICSRDSKDSMDSLHGGWVTDLHFSPDDKVLVSTGGYIKWWSVETGEALQTFYTMGANLKRIHVSSDFSTFVTVDAIGVLYILKRVGL
ncbi:hypothetical protein DNTS_017643 [Danionella cerebrum]|uniref:Apoptotic protease-activating factor 1 n=1 Tax=Danionella cerebrum TaxID=2873325 RepID=A0A553MXB4_9TELE|nr:hypothetical protein DNTS_017643 [Danionella translucida]